MKYQFTWQVSYDLPVGKGRAINVNGLANAILGGWTANGVAYLSTGVPIASPVMGAVDLLLQSAHRSDLRSKQRRAAHCRSVVRIELLSPRQHAIRCWIAPAYLDHVRTMGANDVDVTLSKSFSLGKERSLRFEVSSFNIANKAQFAAPNVPSLASGYPSFGQITTSINSPRQFQFGSRFMF